MSVGSESLKTTGPLLGCHVLARGMAGTRFSQRHPKVHEHAKLAQREVSLNSAARDVYTRPQSVPAFSFMLCCPSVAGLGGRLVWVRNVSVHESPLFSRVDPTSFPAALRAWTSCSGSSRELAAWNDSLWLTRAAALRATFAPTRSCSCLARKERVAMLAERCLGQRRGPSRHPESRAQTSAGSGRTPGIRLLARATWLGSCPGRADASAPNSLRQHRSRKHEVSNDSEPWSASGDGVRDTSAAVHPEQRPWTRLTHSFWNCDVPGWCEVLTVAGRRRSLGEVLRTVSVSGTAASSGVRRARRRCGPTAAGRRCTTHRRDSGLGAAGAKACRSRPR